MTDEPEGDEATSDEDAPAPPEEKRSEDDIDAVDEEAAHWNLVINKFYGGVDAREALFGVERATSPRRVTGRIDRVTVDTELHCFVQPPDFRRAKRTLSDGHLVALRGPESSGKRTTALALLHDVVASDARLTSLSPAQSFEELAEQDFRSGGGYLVQDFIGDGQEEALQRFHVDNLRHKLRATGAYLVITVHELTEAARSSLAGTLIKVGGPDLGKLLTRLLDRRELPNDVDVPQLEERVAAMRRPRDVVNLIAGLAAGTDAALTSADNAEHTQVRSWFDAKPEPHDVLRMTALAFSYGLPERVFERLTARLTALAEEMATGPNAMAKDVPLTLPQRRADPVTSAAFVERQEPVRLDDDRRLVFCSDRHRRWVIAELNDRYGWELWAPIREWLHELAAEPDSEIRLQVALGVALLATPALPEVKASFLDSWANGLVMERHTAAYVLTWMCNGEDLAPVALATAIRWSAGAGERRAATAAVALGLELGIRYQGDALRWLWHLSARSELIRKIACRSIAALFAASIEDPDSATTVLRFIQRELNRHGTSRPGFRRSRLALDTVLAVLDTRRADLAEPVAAVVLRRQSDSVPVLGTLWAEVLRSASHRKLAIDALRDTLLALDPTNAADAGRLGDAIWSNLSEREGATLKPYLVHGLAADPDTDSPSRPIAAALLAAFTHTPPLCFR
ncbi:MAG: hypothetical protein ACRDTA_22805 [Pseudonocardiaceae bacterium]